MNRLKPFRVLSCLGWWALLLKQEGASEEDISRLPKYKFRSVGDMEKLDLEKSESFGGIMTSCGGGATVERVLPAEDAVSCLPCNFLISFFFFRHFNSIMLASSGELCLSLVVFWYIQKSAVSFCSSWCIGVLVAYRNAAFASHLMRMAWSFASFLAGTIFTVPV